MKFEPKKELFSSSCCFCRCWFVPFACWHIPSRNNFERHFATQQRDGLMVYVSMFWISITYQWGGGVVPQAEKWHLEGFKWLHLTFNVKVWWKKCTLHILGENGGYDVIVLRDGGRKISKNGLKNEITIFYLKLIRLTPKLDRETYTHTHTPHPFKHTHIHTYTHTHTHTLTHTHTHTPFEQRHRSWYNFAPILFIFLVSVFTFLYSLYLGFSVSWFLCFFGPYFLSFLVSYFLSFLLSLFLCLNLTEVHINRCLFDQEMSNLDIRIHFLAHAAQRLEVLCTGSGKTWPESGPKVL